MPPATSRALARALGIPHIPPVLDPVELIPLETSAPVSNNVSDGFVTAGFFQFDRVTREGETVPATHDNTPFSEEGTEQAVRFLETWLAGEAEIIDPYELLETPPLAE